MDEKAILKLIRQAVQSDQIKISLHAAGKAIAEEITRTEIKEALFDSVIVENYPTWWLGPCFLLYGTSDKGRDIHIVSSYDHLPVTIITVYEPKPPGWIAPTKRGETK